LLIEAEYSENLQETCGKQYIQQQAIGAFGVEMFQHSANKTSGGNCQGTGNEN